MRVLAQSSPQNGDERENVETILAARVSRTDFSRTAGGLWKQLQFLVEWTGAGGQPGVVIELLAHEEARSDLGGLLGEGIGLIVVPGVELRSRDPSDARGWLAAGRCLRRWWWILPGNIRTSSWIQAASARTRSLA